MTREELLEAARLAGADASIAAALRSKLLPQDFSLVADCLNAAGDEECAGLIGVLGSAPLDLQGEVRAGLAHSLATLVQRIYPRYPASSAWFRWRELDPDRADNFILSDFAISRIGDDPLGIVVRDISSCGKTERVRRRLEEIRDDGGSSAAEAARRLDLHFPSDSGMKALQEAWATNRTPEALISLYYAFMTRKASGLVTKRDVLAVFGKPDDASGPTIWYSPTQGTSLSLHFRDGKLEGTHLT